MAKKARTRKSAPKARARKARAPKGDGQAKARARGGIPGTTVVHVDREVYAALQRERAPEDRGYNAPLRRLIGLGPARAEATA